MMVRRIGGAALVILGVLVLAVPIASHFSASHGKPGAMAPQVLYDLAYIATFGLFLLIVGLYLLTRRASKAPEDNDRR